MSNLIIKDGFCSTALGLKAGPLGIQKVGAGPCLSRLILGPNTKLNPEALKD